MLLVLVVVVVTCVAASWFLRRRRRRAASRLGAPILPGAHWPLGHVQPLVLGRGSPNDLFRQLYESVPAGSASGVLFAGLSTPVLLLRDRQLIQRVTVQHFSDFSDHLFVSGDPLVSGCLMFLKGEKWRRMRATLSPAFSSGRIKDMFGLMTGVADNMMDHLESLMDAEGCSENPVPVEMEDLVSRFSNDVIAAAAFGYDCNSFRDRDNEFFRSGKDITDFSGFKAVICAGHLLVPWLMRALGVPFVRTASREFLLRVVRRAVKERRCGGGGPRRRDVLQLMLDAKHGDQGDCGLTDEEMAAQLMFFLLAGFDSVANLLSVTLYLLTIHPEECRKLQAELDARLAASDANHLSYDELAACKYLDCVVAESLRLYPPAPTLDRQCVRSNSPCRAGDSVVVSLPGLHRDPDLFTLPDDFLPERFLNPEDIPQGAHIPFGAGPRTCIAKRFALVESKVAISRLLLRFDLHVVERTPIPLKLTTRGLNLTVDGGFWVGLAPRKPKTATT